jgi:hypothetical protein
MTENVALIPLDFVDPKEKETPEYLNQIGGYMYWMLNNTSMSGTQYTQFGSSDFSRLQLVRDYYNGMQDPQIYMDLFLKKGEEKGGNNSGVNASMKRFVRKGYANVDWKITGPARLIQATIDSLVGTDKQRVQVVCSSPVINHRKMIQRALAIYDAINNPVFAEVGAPVTNNPLATADAQKLEVHDIMKRFKQDFEIAVEKIAEHGFKISRYDEIEKKLKKDGANFAFMLAADISDPYTGAAKCEYVDPTRTILAYMDRNECEDTPFFGKIRAVQIHTLRDELLYRGADPETVEKVLEKAAKTTYLSLSNSNVGAAARPWSFMVERDPLTNRFRYDGMTIDVVDFEWITKDTLFTKETKRDGYLRVYRDQWGDWVNNDKKKTITYDVHKIIEGLYIPSVNYSIGGYQANQKRINKRKPLLSCCWYKLGGKGMTENAMPRYDQIQIISLKLQNAIRELKLQGIAVDIVALNIGNVGGQQYTATDVIQIYKENGVLLYKSTLGPNGKYSGPPITELKGGLGTVLTELVAAYQHEMEMLLQEMGITPAVMAAGKTPDLVGLGVQQQQATANALSPLQQGLESLRSQLARNMALRAITTMKHDKSVEEYYRNAIGSEYVDAVLTMDGITFDEVGVELTTKVSPLHVQSIMETLKNAQTADRNGNVSIDPNDAIEVIKLIDRGDFDSAEKYLKDSIAEKRKMNAEMTAAASAQQAEQLQQLEVVKMQTAVQTQQMLAEIEIKKAAALEQIKLQADVVREQVKTEGRLEEIKTEAMVQSIYDVAVQGGVPKPSK